MQCRYVNPRPPARTIIGFCIAILTLLGVGCAVRSQDRPPPRVQRIYGNFTSGQGFALRTYAEVNDLIVPARVCYGRETAGRDGDSRSVRSGCIDSRDDDEFDSARADFSRPMNKLALRSLSVVLVPPGDYCLNGFEASLPSEPTKVYSDASSTQNRCTTFPVHPGKITYLGEVLVRVAVVDTQRSGLVAGDFVISIDPGSDVDRTDSVDALLEALPSVAEEDIVFASGTSTPAG